MWKRLPLRFRLFLPTIALIAATLLFGIFALQIFSPDQFENESEDAAALVRTVANGLNAALVVTVNPQQALDAFADGIGTGDAIRYRKPDASPDKPKIRLTTDGVPAWFVSLLRIPNLATAHPITIVVPFGAGGSADLLARIELVAQPDPVLLGDFRAWITSRTMSAES